MSDPSTRSGAQGTGTVLVPTGLVMPINRLATTAVFLSALSHEMNNSLQVISGLVELMEGRTDLPGDVTTKLQKIAAQASRASDTIRLIQGFIRDRSAEPRRLDLREMIARALALRRYPLARANVSVVHEPPPAGTAMVNCVDGLLVLAVVNLLTNAEQALVGRSGSQLRITVECRDGKVYARFVDNGPGIDPSLRDQVFEPFFSTRPPEQALGLGLPVTRQIVEGMGGALRLEESAAGATFVMELPLAS